MSEFIDNRTSRLDQLKEVVRSLHAGADPAEARRHLARLIQGTSGDEVVAMEEQLLREGLDPSELVEMCDVHSQVVRDVLQPSHRDPADPAHPVSVFRQENAAVERELQRMRVLLGRLQAPTAARRLPETLEELRRLGDRLSQLDRHYARKENLLFPHLERHGINGPSQVMWAKDDEVRAMIKAFRVALEETEVTLDEWKVVAAQLGAPLAEAVSEMIFKEERILLPMCLEKLSEEAWASIAAESPTFGWCLVEPPPGAEDVHVCGCKSHHGQAPGAGGGHQCDGHGHHGHAHAHGARPHAQAGAEAAASASPASASPAEAAGTEPAGAAEVAGTAAAAASQAATAAGAVPGAGAVSFPTGALNPAQLQAIFSTLPLDLTFVDADDRVAFFSESEKRIFVRTPAIIGREVQKCHPPASVHVVEQILGDFRAGRQDSASFWIQFKERFVLIRYYAVRDDAGAYMGTLEVTQDIGPLRALEGERRLLSYETPES